MDIMFPMDLPQKIIVVYHFDKSCTFLLEDGSKLDPVFVFMCIASGEYGVNYLVKKSPEIQKMMFKNSQFNNLLNYKYEFIITIEKGIQSIVNITGV